MHQRRWFHRPSSRLASLVAATLVVNLLTLLHGTPAKAADARIMVVGDSISQGIEGDFTWRYRLAEHLAGSGASVDFVGPWSGTTKVSAEVGGAPFHDGAYRPGINFDSDNLAQWGWQMHQAKDVVRGHMETYKPGYLLVELGFNDLGWGVNEPAGLLNDFEWFVYNARLADPYIRIMVANVLHRTPLDANPNLPAKITQYNSLLASRVPELSSSASPITLVDIDSPYDENRDGYDGLHPNIRGEYVIANAFASKLQSVFGLGGSPAPIPTNLPAELTPGPPASITAKPVDDKIKVSWSHVFGATEYEFWQRDATAGGSFTKGQFGIGADSWTAGLLPAGHKMEFYVRTKRGSHVSGPSPVAAATVKALQAPGFWVTEDPKRPYTVTVHWNPVDGADDYHVYAGPGCEDIPPAAASFTKQQFLLGGKTSWTQEYVFDLCRNYVVTASRHGGETPRPDFGVRAFPYQNNPFFRQARDHYLDTEPNTTDPFKGDRRVTLKTTPGEDRGVVVARGFIADNNWQQHLIGDMRSYEGAPQASAKVGFAWDTKTGEIGVYVKHSCAFVDALVCKQAYPVIAVPDASVYQNDPTQSANFISHHRDGENLVVTISAINSLSPVLGRIDAKITLSPRGKTFQTYLLADQFPSWEVYRYPTTSQNKSGEINVIGTRTQNNIRDLVDNRKANCLSVTDPWEEDAFVRRSRPMNCSPNM